MGKSEENGFTIEDHEAALAPLLIAALSSSIKRRKEKTTMEVLVFFLFTMLFVAGLWQFDRFFQKVQETTDRRYPQNEHGGTAD